VLGFRRTVILVADLFDHIVLPGLGIVFDLSLDQGAFAEIKRIFALVRQRVPSPVTDRIVYRIFLLRKDAGLSLQQQKGDQ